MAMKKVLISLTFVLSLIFAACGSGFLEGWKMDYGRAKAHIEDADFSETGKKFVGKKVVVRGVVEKVDFTEKGNPKVFLSKGTECHFGKMEAMAKAIKVCESVVISGIVRRGEDDRLFLSPAMTRDPKAPFKP